MKFRLEITGMSCDHCVNFVKQALTDMNGVEVLNVDLVSALINADDTVTEAQLKAVIEEGGYELEGVMLG